jgi:hypothetical protein
MLVVKGCTRPCGNVRFFCSISKAKRNHGLIWCTISAVLRIKLLLNCTNTIYIRSITAIMVKVLDNKAILVDVAPGIEDAESLAAQARYQ